MRLQLGLTTPKTKILTTYDISHTTYDNMLYFNK
jgi:hypothetical protein